jgi:hypothetical protein
MHIRWIHSCTSAGSTHAHPQDPLMHIRRIHSCTSAGSTHAHSLAPHLILAFELR